MKPTDTVTLYTSDAHRIEIANAASDFIDLSYQLACLDGKRHNEFWREIDGHNADGSPHVGSSEEGPGATTGTIRELVDGTLSKLHEQQAAMNAERWRRHIDFAKFFRSQHVGSIEDAEKVCNAPDEKVVAIPYCHLCHGHGYVLGLDATITKCDHCMVPASPGNARYVAISRSGDSDRQRRLLRQASCSARIVSMSPAVVTFLYPSLPDALEHYVSPTFGPGRIPLEIETWWSFCQRRSRPSLQILRVDLVDGEDETDNVTTSPHQSLAAGVA